MEIPIDLLIACQKAFRGLTIVAGVLVLIDSFKTIAGLQENPPHHPRMNAISWAVVAAGVLAGSIGLISSSLTIMTAQTGLLANLAVLFIWVGISTGLTLRAATRSLRPYLVYTSSTLFLLTGSILSLWG